MRKYFGINVNKNATYQNLLDASKAVLRGKYIVVLDYVEKRKTILKSTM